MSRFVLRFLRGNSLALVALFIALGGTTYAASTKLVAKNSVASPQVVNRSLQTADLSGKARRALKGKRGPRGFTGARGPTGAQGPKGDKGNKGDLGPTAARVVSSSTSVTLTAVEQPVLDLASVNDQGSNQITTTVPSTIMGMAMIRLVTTSATAARSTCSLYISDGTGPTNGLTPMQPGFLAANDTPATSGFYNTYTYIGAATKPAGTYNVQVKCHAILGNLATSQLHQLQVWAVGS